MSNFTYSLVKSPEVITGKTVYHGVVQTNGTLDRDMIAQRLAVRTKQDVALWRYFLDALNDELAEEILAGYRVNLGQLSTGFAIKGSFQSEDERWDAEKHQLIPTVRAKPARISSCRISRMALSSSSSLSQAYSSSRRWIMSIGFILQVPSEGPRETSAPGPICRHPPTPRNPPSPTFQDCLRQFAGFRPTGWNPSNPIPAKRRSRRAP